MKHYWKVLMSVAFALGIVIMGFSPAAHAVPMLKLTSGAATKTIVDGGAGDTDPAAGVVSVHESVGVFTLNITTGKTKPDLGTAAEPQVDLLDLISINTAPGSLTLEFTETGFTAPGPPGFTLAIGGTTDSAVTSVKAYRDASNTAFGHGELLAGLGPLGSGAFSDSVGTALLAAAGGPYSITLEVVIDHTGILQTSDFNSTLLANPEPGTMVLFGTGLISLFGYGWRRRKQTV